MLRIVLARSLSEGLGNEMLPWGKGLIASQVLDAHLVGPTWGRNRRKYYRHFRTSRFDFLLEALLKRLPHYHFTEKAYRETGEPDFGRAIKKWADSLKITDGRGFIVMVEGMWGGFSAIRHSRPFLWSQLLNSRDAIGNIYEVSSKLDRKKLFVAVHMRLGGDFEKLDTEKSLRGQFNVQIPKEWYLSVCHELRKAFGDQLQFHFFTDRRNADFDEAVRLFNPGQAAQQGLTECSDLLLMAQADLRVCSVSSYSMTSCILSEGPYLWHESQLAGEDGFYTMWGMTESEKVPNSLTRQSVQAIKALEPGSPAESEFKGYAIQTGAPVPRGLVTQLRRKLCSKDRNMNLLEYGCLPAWTNA